MHDVFSLCQSLSHLHGADRACLQLCCPGDWAGPRTITKSTELAYSSTRCARRSRKILKGHSPKSRPSATKKSSSPDSRWKMGKSHTLIGPRRRCAQPLIDM